MIGSARQDGRRSTARLFWRQSGNRSARDLTDSTSRSQKFVLAAPPILDRFVPILRRCIRRRHLPPTLAQPIVPRRLS
jgi:hypothetical protein